MSKTKELKESKLVRISLRDYELLRRLAFKAHKPMILILEEILRQHTLKAAVKN